MHVFLVLSDEHFFRIRLLMAWCALALVGKFKKWSQISAPLLKTCIFDGRSSTKKLDSKFGPWLYRRAHHYERRFAPQIAVHDGICAPKMVHETLINGDWRRGSPFSSKSSRNSDGPGGRATTRISSPIFVWKFLH